MKIKTKLYLASDSAGRKTLLNDLGISFESISHNYDEIVTDNNLYNSLDDYVKFVAAEKLNHIDFSKIKEDLFMVLSADTMVYSKFLNKIIGKPNSVEEFREFMIAMTKDYSICASGMALALYKREDREIKTLKIVKDVDSAKIYKEMTEEDMNDYIDLLNGSYVKYASGFTIKSSLAYVKKIEGDYGSIIGIPTFKLNLAIKEIGRTIEKLIVHKSY